MRWGPCSGPDPHVRWHAAVFFFSCETRYPGPNDVRSTIDQDRRSESHRPLTAEPHVRRSPDRPAGTLTRVGPNVERGPRAARPTLRLGLPVRRGLSATSRRRRHMVMRRRTPRPCRCTQCYRPQERQVPRRSRPSTAPAIILLQRLTIPENITLVRLPPLRS